jgi:TorA maturation chaperone TorD
MIAEEDLLRASWYGFVARFLAAPPDRQALSHAAGFADQGEDSQATDGSDLGTALGILGRLARQTTPGEAEEEYFDLFIGVGRGELMPYGSYYLTGFLNEKPLAHLRGDMARLGIARAADVKEPEDHIAALCDMMAGLITGSFGAPAALEIQHEFFQRHLSPWAGRFFSDLERARHARLYQPVGTIGRLLIDIDRAAFGMEA